MAAIYFKNAKTGKRYLVVGRDKEKGTIILKGEYAQFEEPFSKERFLAMGYHLEAED